MVARSPIISPAALVERLDDPGLRVVDVRWVLGSPGLGREAYDAGHIPGAIFLDVDSDLVAPEGPGRHPLPSPADLRARLEAAGIGTEHEVVAYDDVGGWVAARLWWMLDDLGHERVAVLNGGYPAWVAEGLPVTRELPTPTRARLQLADRWSKTIDRAGVAEGLGRMVLLDARGAPRYRGETEPIDPVPGHIPTARNAPTDGNLGPDGRLLEAAQLAARFRALGADGSEGPVVTSCGSGVSACFNSLAMRVAGLPDPTLYPGSYSDWSRSGMPVAMGPEPGDAAPGAARPTPGR
ncbi:MAG: sulfurtransferase [Candidatus Limnocylindrales bacterium]|nr:sulfurtransferase [Candidatus Limnocylindrales bacterium]